MQVHYFCLKHRKTIGDDKVKHWCSRFDCWAIRAYKNQRQLNQIKMRISPEQIRQVKHKFFATRVYIGEDCGYY